jgi:outer membrane protein assembly factor BamD
MIEVGQVRCRILAVLGMLLIAGCGAGVIPPIHSESERLEVARRLFAQGDYTQSIELLKTYVSNNAGSANVDDAIYLLGEGYLKTKEFPSAQVEFERLLRDYPESDSSGSAAFRLGDALFGQSRGPDFDQEFTHKALDQWESYRRSYPGHWRMPEAERRIGETRRRLAAKMLHNGQLYLKLKLGDPARMYFQRVLDDYPETPQAGEARLGLALADAVSGRKPQAIAHLKELETQFPGQPIAVRAAKERERLER